jgi:hypothetical protein
MSACKSILVGAGDIGGARAIMPALAELQKESCRFSIIDHGYISEHANRDWPRITLPDSDSETKQRLQTGFAVYVFGTSVRDSYPLHIARLARQAGIPVVCVLDNWMNYKLRLQMDGLPPLFPDAYAVMDDLAREEAIKDGIPAPILRVTGQATLAGLGDLSTHDQRERILDASELSKEGKKLIVFISEPVEQDQGAARGYTEKSVLQLLAGNLQSFADEVQIGIVPHPRQDAAGLLETWQTCQGKLAGAILKTTSGREAVLIADGVCGMASLLLYEAFLLGKPLLSLQPNLRLPDLFFLKKKGVSFFVTDERMADSEIKRWVQTVISSQASGAVHPELALHRNAPQRLARLICEVGGLP